MNELERSTSCTLTVYTIPYPQGHQGLQYIGNPPASTPFLFHKAEALPVYNLMPHTYSKDRHRHHLSEAPANPNLAASDTEQREEPPTLLISRKVWGPDLPLGCGERHPQLAKGDCHTRWKNPRISPSSNPDRTRSYHRK